MIFDKRTLIVTHIDLDGSVVEIIYKLIYPNADVLRVNYKWEDDEENRKKLLEYDRIVFGDISFRPSLAKLLNSSGKKVLLCDHHDSAIKKFKEEGADYDWIHFDTNRCGAKIVYDYYYNDKLYDLGAYEDLVNLADDYDRWVHNDYRSTRLQFLWSALGKDKFVERFINNPKIEFTDEEEELIAKSENDLNNSYELAIKSMSATPYTDKNGKVFNYCPSIGKFLSLVSTKILREHPELDYLVVNSGCGSISFRSTRYQVNTIAEALGGGGHELAAGAPINESIDVVTSVINHELTKYSFIQNLGVN